MSIPKKIHYVWVGGNEKPAKIKKCMKTWEKHLKDYEIIEWNESNFDINSHPFAKKAYEAKKWAYVSDYIRAYVIYNYGGVYLDTDVIVVEDLEKLLNSRAFVGFEAPDYPFTAVFGAEKNHPLLKDILNYYDSHNFEYDINNELAKVNTRIVSDILIDKYGCLVNNKQQLLKEDIVVYPDGVLCNQSEDTVTIHVFTGTWIENKKSLALKLNRFIRSRLISKKRINLYLKIIRFIKKR